MSLPRGAADFWVEEVRRKMESRAITFFPGGPQVRPGSSERSLQPVQADLLTSPLKLLHLLRKQGPRGRNGRGADRCD